MATIDDLYGLLTWLALAGLDDLLDTIRAPGDPGASPLFHLKQGAELARWRIAHDHRHTWPFLGVAAEVWWR